jgi:triacylglycerol esterase/lipase EstA (alpha/beta hydrolase family)
MTRNFVRIAVAVAMLGCATPAAAQTPAKKPNILVIMGDDIGWFNPSIYHRGIMGYETPNIDRIGKEGALFTDWYGQQSCTAGRAAFITGQSPIRVGHSQGGLDARYVAAVRPDLVASVTTVGTPHTTDPAVDAVLSAYDTGEGFGALLRLFGPSIVDLIVLFTDSDQPEDAIAAFRSLSTPAMAQFNARYPQGLPTTACGQGPPVVNGIRYYSWGGTAVLTNPFDASDALLAVFSPLTPGPSDGFVGRCSSHLGFVIRDNYFQNHFDEINQVLGLRSPFEVDPRSLYRAHANRLKNAGL